MSFVDELRRRVPDRLRDNGAMRLAYRAVVLNRNRALVRARPRAGARFLFRSRELSNFSYGLANLDELAARVGEVLGVDRELVAGHFEELRGDEELRQALEQAAAANPRRDRPRFGYRCGPYAIARILKPRRILELGTHDGILSAVLLRALERNRTEGSEGSYAGFDRTEGAGWIVPRGLLGEPRILIGDVNETLPPVLAEQPPGLLVQDIGASWPGVAEAYSSAIAAADGPLAIFAEINEDLSLRDACATAGGRFATFTEVSDGHFWSGDVRGIALLGAGDPSSR